MRWERMEIYGDILWDRKEWERYGRGYIDWIGDSKEDGAI